MAFIQEMQLANATEIEQIIAIQKANCVLSEAPRGNKQRMLITPLSQ